MTDGLREFICKHCGHTVVVNPNLPDDYTPAVCKQCYDRIERPKHERFERELITKVQALLRPFLGG